MNTALIILNYNNYEDTLNCLDSIDKYNTAPVKYIIVDNGSSRPNTVEALNVGLRNRYGDDYQLLKACDAQPGNLSRVTLLDSGSNDGYACGNNKGLTLAYQDDSIGYVMILNNDVLFVEDIIPPLIDKMNELKDCAIISPVLYKKDLKGIDYNCARKEVTIKDFLRMNFLHYWYKARHKEINENRLLIKNRGVEIGKDVVTIELPSGSCMLTEKEFFREIGSFDPNTFLYYEEDILWQKIKKTGKRNYIDTRCKCIHLGAQSTSSEPNMFLHKIGINSKKYYIKQYLKPSPMMYALYLLSERFYTLSFRLQKGMGIKMSPSEEK